MARTKTQAPEPVWINGNGLVVCKAHAGGYLTWHIKDEPNAREYVTPLDHWTRSNSNEATCEDCLFADIANINGAAEVQACDDCGETYVGTRTEARTARWQPVSTKTQADIDHGPLMCPACIVKTLNDLVDAMHVHSARRSAEHEDLEVACPEHVDAFLANAVLVNPTATKHYLPTGTWAPQVGWPGACWGCIQRLRGPLPPVPTQVIGATR